MELMSAKGRASIRVRQPDAGFSLIEVMVATMVLTVGVLSLVGVVGLGVQTVASSSAMLIAREKAREAVESVHSARDTGELSWSRVRNVADGGAFLDGPQDVRMPGPDGLVNTADDGAIEVLRGPGADGVLNTADDTLTALAPELFQRQITITSLTFDDSVAVNPNLRQIAVISQLQGPQCLAHLHADNLCVVVLMIMNTGHSIPGRASAEAGYSMIELLIAMGITTAIMGATLGGLSDVMQSNDMVVRVTGMNNGLRAGMDLMIRDLLQAGAGLPKGHVISTPSGGGVLIRRPGPPGTAYTYRGGPEYSSGDPWIRAWPGHQRFGHRHDHDPDGRQQLRRRRRDGGVVDLGGCRRAGQHRNRNRSSESRAADDGEQGIDDDAGAGDGGELRHPPDHVRLRETR